MAAMSAIVFTRLSVLQVLVYVRKTLLGHNFNFSWSFIKKYSSKWYKISKIGSKKEYLKIYRSFKKNYSSKWYKDHKKNIWNILEN